MRDFHKHIIIGVETEIYSINPTGYAIGRRLSRPPRGSRETAERFLKDTSIGSEYNSRPFETIREAFFLLKSGFRKYIRRLYVHKKTPHTNPLPLLTGTWTNRFAGTHLHISIAHKKLDFDTAASMARYRHDYIPFLIAVSANSPVWNR